MPWAASVGLRWAVSSDRGSEEKIAPLSRIVLANQASSTFFHGASVASLYLSSHDILIAEQWLSQSISPRPRPSLLGLNLLEW